MYIRQHPSTRVLILKRTRFLIGIAVAFSASSFFGWGAVGNEHEPQGSTKTALTPHLAFDVASIREDRERSGSSIDNPPKSSVFIAHGVTVNGLIIAAYGLKNMSSLKDVPNWAQNTQYDISAKSDAATDEVLAKLNTDDSYAEKCHMLQLLLAERFSLRIHSEIKQSTTYELVATARAAKLMTPVSGNDVKTFNSCVPRFTPHKGMETDCKGYPFPFLLVSLQQDLGTEIVDHTGMTGLYAYRLRFRPSQVTPGADEEWYPDIVHALREQLGLELKKTQGPVTSWVVDHIERPTPN
jgi:uncharacterized protein (TIGR03435 family)